MKRVCIRCDASKTIGSGHTSRCLILGRELKRRNAKVLFVCQEGEGNINEKIKKEFDIRIIKKESNLMEAKKGIDFQNVWRIEMQQLDAEKTISCIKSWTMLDCDWIVVDNYGLDKEWEGYMKRELNKEKHLRILAIDDLANREHLVDILVDQNYMGDNKNNRYDYLVQEKCKKLIGPNYAILGEEYDHYSKIVRSRKKIKKVLVYFGGSDKDGWTEKIIKMLSNKEFKDWKVDVVTGIQDIDCDLFKSAGYELEKRIRIYRPQKSLAELITKADIGIGAGGTTTWERIALGLYTLVITMAKNQEEIAKELNEEGYITLLGRSNEVNEECVIQALRKIKNSKWTPNKMQELVNTKGRKYIATAMLGVDGGIELRGIVQQDKEELLRLANEEEATRNSIRNERIDKASHERWFKDSMQNKNRIIWIIQDEGKLILGQIRFDRDIAKGNIEIDISIEKSVRGYGIASQAIKEGAERIRNKWGISIPIYAQILKHNISSMRCFEKAGFSRKENYKKNENVVWYEYMP